MEPYKAKQLKPLALVITSLLIAAVVASYIQVALDEKRENGKVTTSRSAPTTTLQEDWESGRLPPAMIVDPTVGRVIHTAPAIQAPTIQGPTIPVQQDRVTDSKTNIS